MFVVLVTKRTSEIMTVAAFALVSCSHQDSDDEGNDDNEEEEKPPTKKEFTVRSPSPPAEDSEPEMTEEEKEFQLVRTCLITQIIYFACRLLGVFVLTFY